MKYLGLTLDSHWRFDEHFARMVPRVERTAAALGRLLPNLGGPGLRVRRLYMGVVRSMALYGSPIWAGDLMAGRRSKPLLRRVERRLAIRVVRGFRTTSYAAAMALAGLVPLELQAEVDAVVYDRVKSLRQSGISPPEVARWATLTKRLAQRRALVKWRSQLSESAGKRAVLAVLPSFDRWMGRTSGGLTCRAAQVLTGHGCFGEYLCRIGEVAAARCHHCGEEEDTPQHTLEECPAWSAERRTLRSVVGEDLSPPVLIQRMLEGRAQWDAVASFCEEVMRQKEAAERVRERTDPVRRALGRGRRRGRALPDPLRRAPHNAGGGGAGRQPQRRRPQRGTVASHPPADIQGRGVGTTGSRAAGWGPSRQSRGPGVGRNGALPPRSAERGEDAEGGAIVPPPEDRVARQRVGGTGSMPLAIPSSPKGIKIDRVRRTRTGDVLFEMGSAEEAAKWEKEVKKNMKRDIKIIQLRERDGIKIRGIDFSMEKEEIRNAIAAEVGVDKEKEGDIEVLRLIVEPWSDKTALVKLPKRAADELCGKGNIRIGWTYCKITRMSRILIRCWKCGRYGHGSTECESGRERTQVDRAIEQARKEIRGTIGNTKETREERRRDQTRIEQEEEERRALRALKRQNTA
ncbi:hypothetical protein ANTRET_LOCUS9881 [Anthophora retusa]